MKVAANLESLWQYIHSLSLSERNRKWLAKRLIENPVMSEEKSACVFHPKVKERVEEQE